MEEIMDLNVIYGRAASLLGETVLCRRDLHRYPETCFLEYRTASIVATTLRALGYTVLLGEAVNDTSGAVALPVRETQKREMKRAIREGADPELVALMGDGRTGVVGILDRTAEGEGRTVAFRFDMDANEVVEASDDGHRPAKEGFRSEHEGAMHACGHDGHVAIGLSLAKLLSEERASFSGRIKLIFQPAEEGVRGAEPMARCGVVDDVDVFFGAHIGLSARENGTLIASIGEFLAASKLDVTFVGRSSHAGAAPEEGRNALLAAAQATLALHAIPRHGKGASRVNVGVLKAGTGRNVTPDRAEMQVETRGATEEIGEYMENEARRILAASAAMYGVEMTLERVARAGAFAPDEAFGREVAELARSLPIYKEVKEYGAMNASEDCTLFLSRVTERGGRGLYMMLGAELAAGHHNARFDFSEDVLESAVAFLAVLAMHYAGGDV